MSIMSIIENPCRTDALQGISAVSSTRISAPSPIPHFGSTSKIMTAFWFKQRGAKTCVKNQFKKPVSQTFSVGAPKNPNSRASSSKGTLVIHEIHRNNPLPLVFPMDFLLDMDHVSNTFKYRNPWTVDGEKNCLTSRFSGPNPKWQAVIGQGQGQAIQRNLELENNTIAMAYLHGKTHRST